MKLRADYRLACRFVRHLSLEVFEYLYRIDSVSSIQFYALAISQSGATRQPLLW